MDLEARVTILEEKVENLHAFSVNIKMPEKVIVSQGTTEVKDTSGIEKRLSIVEKMLAELSDRAPVLMPELDEIEKLILTRLGELKNEIYIRFDEINSEFYEKFADKVDTKKALKALEKQIKNLYELYLSLTNN